MDEKRSQLLGDMIATSQKMRTLAREKQWGQVAVLEDQRRERVMEFFKRPIHARDAREVENAIKLILLLNQEVAELGKQCQARVSGDIHTHTVGKAAQAAYLGCAR